LTPAVVLDTNVLLDWWVFRDPRSAHWRDEVVAGRIRWLACPRMRLEFERQLGRAALVRWSPDAPASLAAFDAHAQALPDPAPASPSLRCRDDDDQVFVDLALAHGAKWLLTHDRDLLALARRARRLGLAILKPE
jgi:uncharacterized protein